MASHKRITIHYFANGNFEIPVPVGETCEEEDDDDITVFVQHVLNISTFQIYQYHLLFVISFMRMTIC